ncbi:MAG: hypothetical protein LBJ59_12330 [Zoogloeaceae bacterium]|jgi:hypothetical protein|nr:hypothetical protein [Zoogloeaceae bacterium]
MTKDAPLPASNPAFLTALDNTERAYSSLNSHGASSIRTLYLLIRFLWKMGIVFIYNARQAGQSFGDS